MGWQIFCCPWGFQNESDAFFPRLSVGMGQGLFGQCKPVQRHGFWQLLQGVQARENQQLVHQALGAFNAAGDVMQVVLLFVSVFGDG